MVKSRGSKSLSRKQFLLMRFSEQAATKATYLLFLITFSSSYMVHKHFLGLKPLRCTTSESKEKAGHTTFWHHVEVVEGHDV